VTVYVDASVLVPLFTTDALSQRADRYFDEALPAILLSDFACAEFASAVARKARTAVMSTDEARTAFSAFDTWTSQQATRVQVSSADIALADSFIRRLDLTLRAPDAMHIAMALRLGATLATFDKAMEDSARALGCALADA
jgi:predicted nucleic acid-binding protein